MVCQGAGEKPWGGLGDGSSLQPKVIFWLLCARRVLPPQLSLVGVAPVAPICVPLNEVALWLLRTESCYWGMCH